MVQFQLAPLSPSASSSEILVAAGAISRVIDVLPKGRDFDGVFVLHDSGLTEIAATVAQGLGTKHLISISGGESAKTMGRAEELATRLLELGATRDSLVVNVGGGVVTDLGGFVASVFMRGISFVNVATSMLGMCDAAIGGKTGVDLGVVKNIIGVIAQPIGVVLDPSVLSSLPQDRLCEGLVEVVKMAVTLDRDAVDWLEAKLAAVLARDASALHGVVLRAAQMKAVVVQGDEREAEARMLLNFGHTVGHAVEAASDFSISHGAAVSLGMIAEMHMAACEPLERTRSLLDVLQMPLVIPSEYAVDALWQTMCRDKKVRRGEVRIAVPDGVGKGQILTITREDFDALF